MTGTAEAGQVVQRGLTEPQTDATIRVLGGSGTVEVEVDGEWVELGRATSPWFEKAVKGEVTGVRVVLDAGEANIVELVVAPWEDLREPPTTPPTGRPTDPPTTPPTTPPGAPRYERSAPYTLEGRHTVNGRQWRTTCEPYSQTERCRAEIWASVVKRTGNTYTIERGWAFNNLTYLPFMERAQWATNPLGGYGRYGFEGEFVGTDGQKWRTECDSTASGRNGCRAYRMTTVYYANPLETGGYTFGQTNEWVFNNIVLFGNYAR